MKATNFVLLIAIFILQISCATSNRGKTLSLMLASGAAGSAIGSSVAPEGESPGAHAALWGSSFSALAGIAGLYLFDSEKAIKEKDKKIRLLELSHAEQEAYPSHKNLHAEGDSVNKPIPNDLKGLVKPGKWKRYKLDQWVRAADSPNTWYRQTEMFEMKPPIITEGN